MLWLIFALLTLAAVAILLWPLWKGAGAPSARIDYDIVVYKSQLEEIDDDLAQGQMTQAEADAAKAEVQRRMLAAEDAELAHKRRTEGENRTLRFAAIAAVAIIVPVGAFALYTQLGSPTLPGLPYAWRLQNDPDFVEATKADALARSLQADPTVGGYKRLGQMYFDARDYPHAADAYRKAVNLGASDAETWSEYGESIVMSNGGAVAPEAMSAFLRALSLDAHDNRSKFYVALAEAQIGNNRQAVAVWRNMLQGAPADAPWIGIVNQNIAEFSKAGGFDPATVAPEEPSLEALNASNSAMMNAMKTMPGAGADGGNAAMGNGPPPATDPHADSVHQMVDRLAQRMKTTPNDIAGWQLLAHSYKVLGDNAKARDAIEHAVKLKPDDVGAQLTLAEIEKADAPEGQEPADYAATMRTVLKLDPSNTQALYAVGLAEKNAGHAAAARQMWTKLLSLTAQDDPLAVKAQSQLGALGGK